MGLLFKNCTFVWSEWLRGDHSTHTVLCSSGGVWLGWNDMLFLPLRRRKCSLRKHIVVAVPSALSGVCPTCGLSLS